MKDLSLVIYEPKVTTWIELVPGGLMTVETFTEWNIRSSGHSPLSVKTIKRWTWRAGWQNLIGKWMLMAAVWVLSSTRNEETRVVRTSTPHSHYGCWCNSSLKPDTADA